MSGNQETRIGLPTWRCSGFNAAIPIKKRKYFVQPQEENSPKPYVESDTSVVGSSNRSVMDSFEMQKQTMNVGESLENARKVGDQIRVKVEKETFPLAGFEIPSSSNLFANPLCSSLGKRPVSSAEHTRDIVKGEASAGVANVSLGNEGPASSLNLSLSKGDDSVSMCNKLGVNRSNWDLNTTMDDWEDALDRKTKVKTTTGTFLNSDSSRNDIETSSCNDKTVISGTVASMQPSPLCSLSLGLGSYQLSEKTSSLSPMIPSNVNRVSLRTVKSELIEESAQVSPTGLSMKRVRHEEVSGRFSQNQIRVKAEPDNSTRPEVFDTSRTQKNEIRDLPTSSRREQNDTYIPPQSDLDHVSKGQDYNRNASGVNVTTLTEKNIQEDCNISKELSPVTVEVPVSDDKGKNILSGKKPIVQDGEHSTQQTVHASEGTSSTLSVSRGNVENAEIIDNNSPDSYNESLPEYGEGGFAALEIERDRLSEFPQEPRRYVPRGSDESWRYQRSPRLNFVPDRRRSSDQTETNPHERNTKCFEFDTHGNTRRDNAFTSGFHKGRRPGNDVVGNSFPRRTSSFSYRGQSNNEDDEQMFMSPPRPYQGRNSFPRGRAKYLNKPKRDFPGYRSRSPLRSRERSSGPSSSFRSRSQEEFNDHTDFSRRRSSPSGYRTEKINSPEHSGYPREMAMRRHNSPPNSYRGRGYYWGRGNSRGRGYVRGRGYGREGNCFKKPSDRIFHRNNLDPRERVDYNDYMSAGPGRFGGDVNVERRQFGYRHDGTRQSFGDDTNVEQPDAVRFRQEPDIERREERSLMETDEPNQNLTENASGRSNDMDDDENSKAQ